MKNTKNNYLTILHSQKQELQEQLCECLRRAFQLERPFLEFKLKQELVNANFMKVCGQEPSINEEEVLDANWTAIESLSRLRRLVGGRFETLKDKWQACGFPLKAHRGEALRFSEIDATAWAALSAWINSQGFETKRLNHNQEAFFWVRKKS